MTNDHKNEKTFLFDNPRNVTYLIRGLYIICALLFIADFIVHRHTVHPWEDFLGFYAIYGLLACVILVLISTEIRKVVMRKEDYYDVDE